MIRDYCDNTQCDLQYRDNLYKIRLIKDFNYDVVYWCRACIKIDKNMIDTILNHDNTPCYILNSKFNIK
jgi:hypothetical protein